MLRCFLLVSLFIFAPGDEIANAATTCFLENIAGTTPGERVRNFMGEESRRYFDYWTN